MKKINLAEMASIVRSKNAGPFLLTLDVIFKDRDAFYIAKDSKILTKETIAGLYDVSIENVISVYFFEPAHAWKATIVRPVPSGSFGDADVYGAQQHEPLFQIAFPS